MKKDITLIPSSPAYDSNTRLKKLKKVMQIFLKDMASVELFLEYESGVV
jgi:hypothetical protein